MKYYTVCLCFGREKCETITAALANKNSAADYLIEPVFASMSREIAYRGSILI